MSVPTSVSVRPIDTSYRLSPPSSGSNSPGSTPPSGADLKHSEGLRNRRAYHHRHQTLDQAGAMAAFAAQAVVPHGKEELSNALINLQVKNVDQILPCPLQDLHKDFEALRKKYAEEPRCCGCFEPVGLMTAIFEGTVAAYSATLGPIGNGLLVGGRARFDSWWQNNNISNKTQKSTDLASECQELCDQLQKQYDVLGTVLQANYLNAKYGFSEEKILEIVEKAKNLYLNLENIEKAIAGKLGVYKLKVNLVDAKKIISPLKDSLVNILKDFNETNKAAQADSPEKKLLKGMEKALKDEVSPEKAANFKREDAQLVGRKAYQDAIKKRFDDQDVILSEQSIKIKELMGMFQGIIGLIEKQQSVLQSESNLREEMLLKVYDKLGMKPVDHEMQREDTPPPSTNASAGAAAAAASAKYDG